jgi:Helix-turn-helix domain
VEHHKADVWQVAGRGTAGDDAARFLRELRQLRDAAGLGHAELAARAHYPYDIIKAAEAGPSLPDLPVLSAYVRGCGGTAEEWEERWRRLTRTPSLPVSASRHAGNSAAATAGARIGAVTQVVDAPDPSVIIAALSRVAEGMAVGGPDTDAAPVTIPPRPAYPAEDMPAASSPAVVSPAGMPSADMPPADFPPFTPVAPESPATSATAATPATPADDQLFSPAGNDPLVTPPDDPLGRATGPASGSPAGRAEPEADNRPQGWDPIRVSAAWPAISSEDPRRTGASGDKAATQAGASPSGPSAAASGTRPVIRQSAWARGTDAFGEPTGVARPGPRARALVVVVVLVCVLAVVLAIFA